MNENKTSLVEMESACLTDVMRFIQLDMLPPEILPFAKHVQNCFECREYLRTLSDLLGSREKILEQLDTGICYEH